jgi:hypothetical protein
MVMVDSSITEGVERCARNLEFVALETNTRNELHPSLATPNTVRLFLRHGDAQCHQPQQTQKYPPEQRSRYAQAGWYLAPR